MRSRMFISIPGLYLLDTSSSPPAVITKSASRPGQCPLGVTHSLLYDLHWVKSRPELKTVHERGRGRLCSLPVVLTFSHLLNFSKPQLPHLEDRDANSASLLIVVD